MALEKLRELGPKHGFVVLVGDNAATKSEHSLALRWMRLTTAGGGELFYRGVMGTKIDAERVDEENARELLSQWALARMGVD